jgi:hypothetical protein
MYYPLEAKMAVALDFGLIQEIVGHGAKSAPAAVVDPSTSPVLRDAGVALVATYIQQLSLVGLVTDPRPLFGRDGGAWIGYRLSDSGREVAESDDALRRVVAPLIGGPRTEVSEAVASLQAECLTANIDEIYRDDFLKTLDEIRVCFDHGCFIAAIGLCGKVLEVCLKEILLRHDIRCDPNAMVGTLIRSIRERVPGEYLDPTLLNVVNVINASRITAVHAKERIPVPSRDQAVMVIFATRDVVRRNLSHKGSVG